MSQSQNEMSASDLWETQSNASEMGNTELETLSESTFDQLPPDDRRSSVAKRNVTLYNVPGGQTLVISENEDPIDLAKRYCSTNGLDFDSEGGTNIAQQISFKQLQLLRWKLSQTRKRLKKATSQAVKQKFRHAVNLLQRTQHDKKKLTVKLATTRNNMHEKTEELVHTLSSLTRTTTELNEVKSMFENYKKEKERIVMEIEERSIAQMQKVVLERTSMDSKVEERIESVKNTYQTELEEASKEFETQYDELQKVKSAAVAKLQLGQKMANNQVARLTRQLEAVEMTKQLELDAKLRRNIELKQKLQKVEAMNATKSEQMEQMRVEMKASKKLRDEAVAAAAQALSAEDCERKNTMQLLANISVEEQQLAISKAVDEYACQEERKVQERTTMHENRVLEMEHKFTADLQKIQHKANNRIALEIQKASNRVKKAEEEAELRIRDAQSSFSKRRSSIIEKTSKLRRNSIQEKSALSKQAQQDLQTLQTSHQQKLKHETTKSNTVVKELQATLLTHQNNIATLQNKNDALQTAMNDHTAKSATQVDKAQLDEVLSTQENLREQIAEKTTRINGMANDHRVASQKMIDNVSAAELALTSARKQVTQLQSDLVAEKNQNKQLQKQLDTVQTTHLEQANNNTTKLQLALDNKTNEIEKQLTEKKNLVAQLDDRENTINGLKKRVEDFKVALNEAEENTNIEVQLVRKETANIISELTSEMNILDVEHAQELGVVVKDAEDRVEDLESKFAEAMAMHQMEAHALSQLKVKYQEAEDRAEDLESKFAEAMAMHQMEAHALTQLKAQHQKTTQRAEDLDSKNIELQQKNGSLNSSKEERLQVEEKHELLVARHDNLMVEHEKLVVQHDVLKVKYEERGAKAEQLEMQKEQTKVLTQTVAEKEKAIVVAQKKMEKKIGVLVRSQVEDRKSAKKKFDSALAGLNSKLSTTSSDLENEKQRVHTLQQEHRNRIDAMNVEHTHALNVVTGHKKDMESKIQLLQEDHDAMLAQSSGETVRAEEIRKKVLQSLSNEQKAHNKSIDAFEKSRAKCTAIAVQFEAEQQMHEKTKKKHTIAVDLLKVLRKQQTNDVERLQRNCTKLNNDNKNLQEQHEQHMKIVQEKEEECNKKVEEVEKKFETLQNRHAKNIEIKEEQYSKTLADVVSVHNTQQQEIITQHRSRITKEKESSQQKVAVMNNKITAIEKNHNDLREQLVLTRQESTNEVQKHILEKDDLREQLLRLKNKMVDFDANIENLVTNHEKELVEEQESHAVAIKTLQEEYHTTIEEVAHLQMQHKVTIKEITTKHGAANEDLRNQLLLSKEDRDINIAIIKELTKKHDEVREEQSKQQQELKRRIALEKSVTDDLIGKHDVALERLTVENQVVVTSLQDKLQAALTTSQRAAEKRIAAEQEVTKMQETSKIAHEQNNDKEKEFKRRIERLVNSVRESKTKVTDSAESAMNTKLKQKIKELESMNVQISEKFQQAETEQNELSELKVKYQEAKHKAEDLVSKNVELQQKNGSLNSSKEERLQVEETHELLVVKYDKLVTEHQELLENYQTTKERIELLESKQLYLRQTKGSLGGVHLQVEEHDRLVTKHKELLDNYQAVQLQLQTATQSQAALAIDQNDSNKRRPKELEETTVKAAVSLALATQAKKYDALIHNQKLLHVGNDVQQASRLLLEEQKAISAQRKSSFNASPEKASLREAVLKAEEEGWYVKKALVTLERKMKDHIRAKLEWKATAERLKTRNKQAESKMAEMKKKITTGFTRTLRKTISEYSVKNEVRFDRLKHEERQLRHTLTTRFESENTTLRLALLAEKHATVALSMKQKKDLDKALQDVQRLSRSEVDALTRATAAKAEVIALSSSRKKKQEVQQLKPDILNKIQSKLKKAQTTLLETINNRDLDETTCSVNRFLSKLYSELYHLFSERLDALLDEIDRLKGTLPPGAGRKEPGKHYWYGCQQCQRQKKEVQAKLSQVMSISPNVFSPNVSAPNAPLSNVSSPSAVRFAPPSPYQRYLSDTPVSVKKRRSMFTFH